MAYARRGIVALESIAASLRSLDQMQKSEWERKNVRPKANPIEISSFDVDAANKQWRLDQEAIDMERR